MPSEQTTPAGDVRALTQEALERCSPPRFESHFALGVWARANLPAIARAVLAAPESAAPPPDVADALARYEKAIAMIGALCTPRGQPGAREWIMSIPARPGEDPDLVIGDALHALEKALRAADAHRSEWADAYTRLLATTPSPSASEEVRTELDVSREEFIAALNHFDGSGAAALALLALYDRLRAQVWELLDERDATPRNLVAVTGLARRHGWNGGPSPTLDSWLDHCLSRPVGVAASRALARASTTWESLEREINDMLERKKIRTDLVSQLAKSLDEAMQEVARAVVVYGDEPKAGGLAELTDAGRAALAAEEVREG